MSISKIEKITLLVFIAVAVLFTACSSESAPPPAPTTSSQTLVTPTSSPASTSEKQSNLPDRVDVVYFQRGNPCACMAVIGENIHTVVLKYFQDEMTTGKLTFQMLASDDKANIAMVRKYDTAPFGLFLTIVKGKTEKIVPVEEIWGMTGDEAKYKGYVKNLIAKGLKGEL